MGRGLLEQWGGGMNHQHLPRLRKEMCAYIYSCAAAQGRTPASQHNHILCLDFQAEKINTNLSSTFLEQVQLFAHGSHLYSVSGQFPSLYPLLLHVRFIFYVEKSLSKRHCFICVVLGSAPFRFRCTVLQNLLLVQWWVPDSAVSASHSSPPAGDWSLS